MIFAFDVLGKIPILDNGSTDNLSMLRRGVYPGFKIFLRQPNSSESPTGLNPYEKFDITGYDGIRVGIWSASPGTADPYVDENNGTLLTLTDQTGWTYNTDDPDNPYWTGQLNLNTPEIVAWLGTETCRDAYLAVYLVSGADTTPVYDFDKCDSPNIEIRNRTDPGSGNSTNMTGANPVLIAPTELLFPNGNRYALTETAPGTVSWSWINPPE
jgi:hypothetical protein